MFERATWANDMKTFGLVSEWMTCSMVEVNTLESALIHGGADGSHTRVCFAPRLGRVGIDRALPPRSQAVQNRRSCSGASPMRESCDVFGSKHFASELHSLTGRNLMCSIFRYLPPV